MDTTKTSIIDKIKKLMEMTISNGCSESEAQNAAQKISRLMLKHRIEEHEIKITATDKFKDEVTHGRTNFHKIHRSSWKWQITLGAAIAEVFGCRAMFLQPKGKRPGHMTFVGSPTDIEVSVYMFNTLCVQFHQIATIARGQAYKDQMEECGNYTIGKNWFRDFHVGITKRVSERLIEDFKKAVDETGAKSTMLAVYDENKAYIAKQFGRVRYVNIKSDMTNHGAYKRGMRAGNRVDIPNPHASKIGSSPKRLGA